MYPIPRIISSLSVAPGGCVIVCWCADTPAAVCAVTPVDSQPDVFFFSSLAPYSGTAAVPGSPWQPWDGALEAITAVLWWHSNSYHYTSSKETQREEEEGGEKGKGEMRQGRMDGERGCGEADEEQEKEVKGGGRGAEMWKVNGGRQVKGAGRQRGNRQITQAGRDGNPS